MTPYRQKIKRVLSGYARVEAWTTTDFIDKAERRSAWKANSFRKEHEMALRVCNQSITQWRSTLFYSQKKSVEEVFKFEASLH